MPDDNAEYDRIYHRLNSIAVIEAAKRTGGAGLVLEVGPDGAARHYMIVRPMAEAPANVLPRTEAE